MRTVRLGALLIAVQALALAQLDPDTLTINITRNLFLQPDQVGVNVFVMAPPDSVVDDVLAALPGVGLTAANLTAAGGTYTAADEPKTYWSFSLAVPFAKLKDTITALRNAQGNSTVNVAFYTTGPQTSPELLASQPCPYASLVSYARTQAQKLAAAAGVNLGPIIGVSDSPGGIGIAVPVLVAGFLGSPIISGIPAPSPVSISCAMAVQFKLLR